MNKLVTIFLMLLLCFLSLLGCSSKLVVDDKTLGEQALKIVIFKGINYHVTNVSVDPILIEQKIGQINSYSSKSGEHYIVDAFSNAFPIGTELYKIKDNDVDQQIVIKSDSIYLRAIKR
jgi:hypothetical protein